MNRRASIMEAAPIAEWRESKWSLLCMALVKERRIRQYFTNDTLVREACLKKVEYEELLLDLCIVFNIAFLSHTLKSTLSGVDSEFQIERFGLVMGLVFMGWRNNAFRFNLLTTVGTDLINKLEVLALVLAFTGIGVGAPIVFEELGRRMTALSGFFVLSMPSVVVIVGAWESPLRIAGRPRLLNHAILRGVCQLACALPYLAICFAPVAYTRALYFAGFFSNLLLDFLVDLAVRRWFRNVPGARFYAVCIETWTERHSLLTLMSFGESALTLLYVVDGMLRGESTRKEAGSIFASIVCLFTLLYAYVTQYFEIDNRIASGHGACHAVRRSVFTAIIWSLTHYCILFGLVTVAVGYGILLDDWYGASSGAQQQIFLSRSAASATLKTPDKATGTTLRAGIFLTGAETLVSYSLVILSACHKSSDREVTKPYRLLARVAVSTAIMVSYSRHIAHGLSPALQWVYTAVQGIMTVLEFGIVRMDAAGWWLAGGDDDAPNSAFHDSDGDTDDD
jgi:low temperature requirement protein LtrA